MKKINSIELMSLDPEAQNTIIDKPKVHLFISLFNFNLNYAIGM